MISNKDDQMVHITGTDELGWSWRRVDLEGVTVAEGESALASEAVRAAYDVVEKPCFGRAAGQ